MVSVAARVRQYNAYWTVGVKPGIGQTRGINGS